MPFTHGGQDIRPRITPATAQWHGPTCRTCFWWFAGNADRSVGQCRAHAPQVVIEADRPKSYWPLSRHFDFCGEHTVARDDPIGADAPEAEGGGHG